MTIHNQALNSRLGNLERCAELSPDGTYEVAKAAAEAISQISNFIHATLLEAGLKCNNADPLRDVDAAVYGLLIQSNPECLELVAAEGFGEAMDSDDIELRSRVMGQAFRDRNALRAQRA